MWSSSLRLNGLFHNHDDDQPETNNHAICITSHRMVIAFTNRHEFFATEDVSKEVEDRKINHHFA